MSLTGKQRRYLRGLAHHRRPAITIGSAGTSATVLAEIDQALCHHELLKLQFQAGDKTERRRQMQKICSTTGAEDVQQIGRMGVIYRAAEEPTIPLPGR